MRKLKSEEWKSCEIIKHSKLVCIMRPRILNKKILIRYPHSLVYVGNTWQIVRAEHWRKSNESQNGKMRRIILALIFTLILIKVGPSPSKKVCFIYFNESPLKMMKNAFHFMLKALFVLKILKYLSWLFRHEKWL